MAQAQSGGMFGRLATGAAFGLVAGLALPHARRAVMQGSAGDWATALTAEHQKVQKAFEALLQTSDEDMAKRELLLTKIAYALTKHAIEEENVIYPALAEAGFGEAARHLVADHGEVKTFIYDLRRLSSSDLKWINQARQLWAKLQAHVREEEDKIFPELRQRLSPEDNAKLTTMMNWEGFKVA
jgi:hemerythrin superfamily protein